MDFTLDTGRVSSFSHSSCPRAVEEMLEPVELRAQGSSREQLDESVAHVVLIRSCSRANTPFSSRGHDSKGRDGADSITSPIPAYGL